MVEQGWTFVRDFMNASKTMALRIKSQEMPKKFEGAIPLVHYSWQLVRVSDGKSYPYFPMLCAVNDGHVIMDEFNWDEFIEMFHEAAEWVRAQRQDRESMLAARRAAKELKRA